MATTEVALVIPQRRPRLSEEVIDVDSFDDDIAIVGFMRNQRPSSALDEEGLSFSGFMLPNSRRRRLNGDRSRETGPSSVIIVDSDDEASVGNPSARIRGRLISPPPPVAGSTSVPPVPSLPRHLVSQGSFPWGRRSHLPPVPPIRPNQEPFPFEPNIWRPPPRAPTPPIAAPPPAPAARSHHQPVMGLGGALIAMHRQTAEQERETAERRRGVSQWLARAGFFDFIYGIPGRGNDRHEAAEDRWYNDELLDNSAQWAPEGGGHNPFGWFNIFGGPPQRGPGPPEAKFFRPEYTHPGKPGAGFMYDFATPDSSAASGSSSPTVIVLDDDDEVGPGFATAKSAATSSVTAVETTLVCARCLDPLVMGLMDEDTAKESRVWVLRCGHMLDGKCIDEIMRPSVPSPTADPLMVKDIKGKGKARAGTLVDPDPPEVARDTKGKGKMQADLADSKFVDPPIQDRKGKSKAVDVVEPLPAAIEPDNSIRSRLRSRHAPAVPPAPTEPAVAPSDRPTRPLPRRRITHPPGPRLAKMRGKGRARKPVVEREYEWTCSVSGCGRVHVSVCVDGQWRMDEARGAVAAFL